MIAPTQVQQVVEHSSSGVTDEHQNKSLQAEERIARRLKTACEARAHHNEEGRKRLVEQAKKEAHAFSIDFTRFAIQRKLAEALAPCPI